MPHAKPSSWWDDALTSVKSLTGHTTKLIWQLFTLKAFSHQLHAEAVTLAPRPENLKKLRVRLERKLKTGETSSSPKPLISGQQEFIERIHRQTEKENRNNVTRTSAYYRLFRAFPELHWAFLAHMVSRNGGWSMTDLKGELLPNLLSRQLASHLFEFLERCNALIFQDAYPQLLLYEESRNRSRPLFSLLPYFHVSRFMQPVWDLFWDTRDSVLLTEALIVNEQQYIEGRVVQNEYFKQHALDTAAFQLQSLLQLNQVFFPYEEKDTTRLAGMILEQFAELRERIAFGKALYAVLFGIPTVHQGALRFAERVPHTGSRVDYAPRLFAAVRKTVPGSVYKQKLDGCQLQPGAEPLYSPSLAHAWKDQPIRPIERYDWFTDKNALDYLGRVRAPNEVDMTTEACNGLAKIELAVLAGETLK